MTEQAARAVVMVRPHAFRINDETAADNRFQAKADIARAEDVRVTALHEFDQAVKALRHAGVKVHVFEDKGEKDTPDSLFPNNWISADAHGRVALYPMYTPNRRRERRQDVVDFLTERYQVEGVADWTKYEWDGQILEGTGSMVIDHQNGIAYAARSQRTDADLFLKFCAAFDYEPVLFDAVDRMGVPIYHTNVVMSICTGLAFLGAECIPDVAQRTQVITKLSRTGHQVLELSARQIEEFAGNCLELAGKEGSVLAISARAVRALTPDQISTIEKHMTILPLTIPTIEMAGGSVRCLMADIHLPEA